MKVTKRPCRFWRKSSVRSRSEYSARAALDRRSSGGGSRCAAGQAEHQYRARAALDRRSSRGGRGAQLGKGSINTARGQRCSGKPLNVSTAHLPLSHRSPAAAGRRRINIFFGPASTLQRFNGSRHRRLNVKILDPTPSAFRTSTSKMRSIQSERSPKVIFAGLISSK